LSGGKDSIGTFVIAFEVAPARSRQVRCLGALVAAWPS
jgi:hypothetical protein